MTQYWGFEPTTPPDPAPAICCQLGAYLSKPCRSPASATNGDMLYSTSNSQQLMRMSCPTVILTTLILNIKIGHLNRNNTEEHHHHGHLSQPSPVTWYARKAISIQHAYVLASWGSTPAVIISSKIRYLYGTCHNRGALCWLLNSFW